ncbi:MAG: zinc ribbon domain-containing protein [Caldisericia bacterium]|nr:zinc ribbon domain-containing protein [Caldisericia bacterium]
MKKICPLCGTENEEDARFCKECNEPLYNQDNSFIREDKKENQTFDPMPNKEEKNAIVMIKEIWNNLFNSCESAGFSIAPKEDIEDIISMFIEDRIDPGFFVNNLEALLLNKDMSSFEYIISFNREKPETSKSLSPFITMGRRLIGAPLWFLAAYPDVMLWLSEQKYQYIKLHNRDYDGWDKEMLKIFGIDLENQKLNKDQIITSYEFLYPKYYNNLKKHYKEVTKKRFEVAVVEKYANNIYLGAEFLNAMGAENNFTLIAENTTKYYLELAKNHKGRVANEVALLATAGMLDAQIYFFIDRTISTEEIIDIAKKAISVGGDSLINFIIELEIKLFKVDNPEIALSVIEDVCFTQKATISKTIQKTKENYNGEQRIVSDVELFMNSIKFKPYREMLGIKNKFLFL